MPSFDPLQKLALLIDRGAELEVALHAFCWANRQMLLHVEQYLAAMRERQEWATLQALLRSHSN